jgi:hypothetical protein
MTVLPYVQKKDGLPRDVITRGEVIAFESVIKQHPGHVTAEHFVTKHHFLPGIYIRELHIPQGYITTGRIHKHECISILSKGQRATLVDGRIEVVTAPYTQITPPGFKRISLTLENSVWSTVHLTDLTDIKALEKELVCDTEGEYQAFLADEAGRKWPS